ncbi:MAG TPA: helix-hairpin-helix domain-containing protein [Anaerolineales bacterium]|nr:helix-hairpin-helix domain-containing protein [Anaerolineales bacterium]
MSDFLTFINNADIDTLASISGINRATAENLIAARSFTSEEDCLKVKGMGKALLVRLQSAAEAQGNESEDRSMVPVQQEAPPVFVEQSQPASTPPQKKDSFFKRMWLAFLFFLRALVRLVLLTILIVGIGALLYFGLPYVQNTFIAPVEQNSAQIVQLENEVAALHLQLDEVNSRLTTLEGSVEAHTASIQTLGEMQAALEAQLQVNNDVMLMELKHEVMFTRSLDILARGRLYLSQSNFGLARVDVQTARDLLAELQSETDDTVLAQAITRLDMALGNLPDFPVIASGDLEIAWQILMSGVAPPTPMFVPTSTPPVETGTITPTLVLVETFTPTPLPPPTIEVTPTP